MHLNTLLGHEAKTALWRSVDSSLKKLPQILFSQTEIELQRALLEKKIEQIAMGTKGGRLVDGRVFFFYRFSKAAWERLQNLQPALDWKAEKDELKEAKRNLPEINCCHRTLLVTELYLRTLSRITAKFSYPAEFRTHTLPLLNFTSPVTLPLFLTGERIQQSTELLNKIPLFKEDAPYSLLTVILNGEVEIFYLPFNYLKETHAKSAAIRLATMQQFQVVMTPDLAGTDPEPIELNPPTAVKHEGKLFLLRPCYTTHFAHLRRKSLTSKEALILARALLKDLETAHSKKYVLMELSAKDLQVNLNLESLEVESAKLVGEAKPNATEREITLQVRTVLLLLFSIFERSKSIPLCIYRSMRLELYEESLPPEYQPIMIDPAAKLNLHQIKEELGESGSEPTFQWKILERGDPFPTPHASLSPLQPAHPWPFQDGQGKERRMFGSRDRSRESESPHQAQFD